MAMRDLVDEQVDVAVGAHPGLRIGLGCGGTAVGEDNGDGQVLGNLAEPPWRCWCVRACWAATAIRLRRMASVIAAGSSNPVAARASQGSRRWRRAQAISSGSGRRISPRHQRARVSSSPVAISDPLSRS